MTVSRLFLVLGSVSALLSVAAGAFGAHALRERVTPDLLVTFETGARYQMYHALALCVVAWVVVRWEVPQAAWAGWFFVAGTVLFSGSLYLLALTGTRWWGAVTPFGGLAFLAGWGLLAWAALAAR
ncbi:MAG: DUF423 domain-containing protein [Gemmatimonadales bacterium]